MNKELRFIHERSTKNTERYQEVPTNGEDAVVGTLYIKRSAFGDGLGVPDELLVTITITTL